ncbi:hypothetical protein [Capillimicrobium parvum]|uniref:Uncharacterized protein n=1 Tax=Capillimicrobium parvum TaxID=2884022 RepID=A0A9E7C193_9ACTN|nr:hypothetical protein [Capillimicrobium parvum]UGS36342.1 hypothetical protein DSM104329_02746 [Capillimicrobium parvum]
MSRLLAVVLAVVVAAAGVVALMLILQSRDDASLDRPGTASTQRTP